LSTNNYNHTDRMTRPNVVVFILEQRLKNSTKNL